MEKKRIKDIFKYIKGGGAAAVILLGLVCVFSNNNLKDEKVTEQPQEEQVQEQQGELQEKSQEDVETQIKDTIESFLNKNIKKDLVDTNEIDTNTTSYQLKQGSKIITIKKDGVFDKIINIKYTEDNDKNYFIFINKNGKWSVLENKRVNNVQNEQELRETLEESQGLRVEINRWEDKSQNEICDILLKIFNNF